MCVQDERMRKHRVHQRLDGCAAVRRAQAATGELAGHGFVGQCGQVDQPKQVGEIQGDEIARLDAGEIDAGGLDEERGLLLTERVRQRALARGVAAAMHGEVRIRAE